MPGVKCFSPAGFPANVARPVAVTASDHAGNGLASHTNANFPAASPDRPLKARNLRLEFLYCFFEVGKIGIDLFKGAWGLGHDQPPTGKVC